MKSAKIIKKRVRGYTAIFEPAKEGGYVVSVPSIPGCFTQGETLQEAQRMAEEVIILCTETLKDLEIKESLSVPAQIKIKVR